MTEDDLGQIEEAAARAMVGPWQVGQRHTVYTAIGLFGEERLVAQVYYSPGHNLTATTEFIAKARLWVPQLLAEVRRLQVALDLATSSRPP